MDELINLSFLVTKNMSLLITIIQGFQLNQTRNSKRGESFLKSERRANNRGTSIVYRQLSLNR